MKLVGEGGFSLIELILVITLIGIILSIVMPVLDLNRYQVDKSAQLIYVTLQKARYTAISEKEDYFIHIFTGNRLGIKRKDSSSYREIVEIDQNLILGCTRSDQTMKFTPLGTAVSGSFIVSDGSYSKRVVVAGNGFIRIE